MDVYEISESFIPLSNSGIGQFRSIGAYRSGSFNLNDRSTILGLSESLETLAAHVGSELVSYAYLKNIVLTDK